MLLESSSGMNVNSSSNTNATEKSGWVVLTTRRGVLVRARLALIGDSVCSMALADVSSMVVKSEWMRLGVKLRHIQLHDFRA